MLAFIAGTTAFLGVLIYGACLKKYECRSLAYGGVLAAVGSNTVQLCQILRLNLAIGIDDFTFLAMDVGFLMPLAVCFMALPSIVLLQKNDSDPRGVYGECFHDDSPRSDLWSLRRPDGNFHKQMFCGHFVQKPEKHVCARNNFAGV